MAIDQYLIFIEDLIRPHRNVTSKALFGGYGLYCDGIIFAIIVEGRLYFKVDDLTRKDYELLGSEPFSYQGKQRVVTMSYMTVPESILENSEKLPRWIDRACQASVRHRSKKPKKESAPKKRNTHL